mgnify:CR=1 FL=1
MEVIWAVLSSLFFILTVIWSVWFTFIILSYYIQWLLIHGIKMVARFWYLKKLTEWKSPKIKIERYYSLFRTPAMFYFSLPFITLFLSSFLSDYVLRKLVLNNSILFVIPIFIILFFWISVYIVFSQVKEKIQIRKTIKAHRQFIKITMFPVSLLSIIVPILSAINIIIENEMKQNLFKEIFKFNLNSNSMAISFLFIFILVLEGLSLLVIGFSEHILENESEYGYFFNGIISFFKNII